MISKLPGWLNTLIAAGVITACTSVVLTQVNADGIETLKQQQAAANAAQIRIREDISALKTGVEKIEERQKEDRAERRAAEERVDDKLDALLRK